MIWAVVPAAGRGSRVGGDVPKQHRPILGRPLIRHTLERLAGHPRIAGLMVVLAADDNVWPGWRELRGKPVHTAIGGAERADSVLAGLAALPDAVRAQDWVLVHDAARPCLRHDDLDRLLDHGCAHDVGAILAVPVSDTLKRDDGRGTARRPLARADAATVPSRHAAARARCRRAGRHRHHRRSHGARMPRAVADAGRRRGRQHQGDHAGGSCVRRIPARTDGRMSAMRIGTGYDVHAFGDGDHVVLGGVSIPHSRGIVAHSDGDVLIHALCDGLLGALALGDIGKYFPPTDERWRGADSRDLLRAVVAMLHQRGWGVGNVDSVVVCERPKLAPHIDAMRANLAADLSVPIDAVGVKATTSEKLGFTGREEGIAAQAVVLLCARA